MSHKFFYKFILLLGMLSKGISIYPAVQVDEPLGGTMNDSVVASIQLDGLEYSLFKFDNNLIGHDSLYCLITGYDDSLLKQTVIVPGSVKINDIEYRVSVGSEVFKDNYNIRSVIFCNGVNSIGRRAFENCRNIETISFHGVVSMIGHSSFEACSGLKSLTLECADIMPYAFAGCTSLKTATVKSVGISSGMFKDCISLNKIDLDSMQNYTIGNEAFMNCNSLDTVSLNGCLKIFEDAFRCCGSLTNVNLGEELIQIGDRAFMECTDIKSMVIPSTVMEIGIGILRYCTNLDTIEVMNSNPVYSSNNGCNVIIKNKTKELIAGCRSTIFPLDVVAISDYAFNGHDIKSVLFSSQLRSIGKSAFEGCQYLNFLNLPDGLQFIGDSAFYACKKLDYVDIPETVLSIGDFAFDGCGNINVRFHSTTYGDY